MKKNIVLITLFLIMILNLVTFLLIFLFWDPYTWSDNTRLLWIISILSTFWISSSCFIWIIIYFIKKRWYSGDIYMKNIFSSLRQWFLLTAIWMILFYFNYLSLFNFKTIILLFIITALIEMTFKNLEK